MKHRLHWLIPLIITIINYIALLFMIVSKNISDIRMMPGIIIPFIGVGTLLSLYYLVILGKIMSVLCILWSGILQIVSKSINVKLSIIIVSNIIFLIIMYGLRKYILGIQ